jgi:hypothetical protein
VQPWRPPTKTRTGGWRSAAPGRGFGGRGVRRLGFWGGGWGWEASESDENARLDCGRGARGTAERWTARGWGGRGAWTAAFLRVVYPEYWNGIVQ